MQFKRCALLTSAVLLPAAARGDVLSDWNKAVTDTIIASKINSNDGARMLAITHNAQFRAVKDVLKSKGLSLEGVKANPQSLKDATPALNAALASAGKTALNTLWPASNATNDALYQKHVPSSDGLMDGIDAGLAAANAVLAERANDGSSPAPPAFLGSNDTGKWRPTPPLNLPGLTPQYAKVKPFTLDSPDQFRLDPPPALNSDTYKKSYDEVRTFNKTSSVRTQDQTDLATFWSGNVEVLLSDPVRQVASNLSVVDAAKLYAIASTAMADARIAAWDSKYTHLAWRPVTAIPNGNGGIFPADPTFTTLFNTPNHPEFPQGHSTTGEAVAVVLRSLTGKDQTSLTLSSYSLPTKNLTYTIFSDISKAIAESRVLGGVHYRHSIEPSFTLGGKVGNKVLQAYGEKTTQRNLRVTA